MTEEVSKEKKISNFTDMLSEQAKESPDTIAIYAPRGSLTYKHLETLIWKMATFLNKKNVKHNDVVALTFKNELTLFITMLAVARIGATAFSVPRDTPKIQNNTMVTNVKAKFLITDIADRKERLLSVLFMDINTLMRSSLIIDFNVRATDPDAPWLFITGSGSTGKSKIMPIHHQQQIQRMKSSLKWLPLSKGDRTATLVHLDHYVSKSLYLDTLSAGLSIVLFDRTSIKPITLFKRYNISLLHATVFHIHTMLKSLPESYSRVLPSLKALLIGGSSVPDPLRKQIAKRLTPNLYVRYGINEVGTISVAHAPDVYHTAGTVGKVLPGVLVDIVNSNLQTLPLETIGLIRIKSTTIIDGYLHDEEETKHAFKDGWFYPGDLGKFTLDGQLIHLGRSDDMMIMAGNNIYPAEIQQVITAHSEVEDAAAMPIKSSVHQDIPVCAVVLSQRSKLTEKALLEYTYQRLGARGPKRVIMLESIPRNEQGKLIRQELADAINLKLRTHSRGNTVPTKEHFNQYTQLMKPFAIRLNKVDLPESLEHIDEWLTSVLRIDIEPLPNTALKVQNITLEYIWRTLLLTRTLLQSIHVPIFDPGEIMKVDESSPRYYAIVVSMIQVDYISQKVYIKSLQTALNTILNLKKRPITPENRQMLFQGLKKEFMTPLNNVSGSGKSTMPILQEAHQRNIPFRHLKNGIYQLGWGSKSRRMDRSSTELDSRIGAIISHNKINASALVREAGLPAPIHKVARSKEEALSAAKEIEWPIVVKPADLDRGEGVTVDVRDDSMLIAAFTIAQDISKSKQVIIERQVDGVCCRIFIADQKMLYAVKRLPKSIQGNGVNSIRELIAEANIVEDELPPWKRSEPFPLDEMAIEAINTAGFKVDDIPKLDHLIPLRRIESTQWGGVDEDITNTIHPDNIDLALRAAKLFGLHVSGIDIITPDITVPWYENGAIVNEVNFSPLFGGGEISRRAIPLFFDDFIQGDGRIPITVIVGGAEAMDHAMSIQQEQLDNGMQSFISSHQKSVSWTGDQVYFTFNSLYKRCQALLMDSRVDSLILVVQTDEFLQTGLPVDSIHNLITTSQQMYLQNQPNKPLSTKQYDQLTSLMKMAIK